MKKNSKNTYWFERVIFIIGTLFLFSSEFLIMNSLEQIDKDKEYFELNLDQVQRESDNREHWLAEYNLSVSSKLGRDSIGINACKLYISTDQLLTLLDCMLLEGKENLSQKLIDSKNLRVENVENLLANDEIEELVSLLNKITEEHDNNIELKANKVMVLINEIYEKHETTNTKRKWFFYIGSLMLAIAFIIRELKNASENK